MNTVGVYSHPPLRTVLAVVWAVVWWISALLTRGFALLGDVDPATTLAVLVGGIGAAALVALTAVFCHSRLAHGVVLFTMCGAVVVELGSVADGHAFAPLAVGLSTLAGLVTLFSLVRRRPTPVDASGSPRSGAG